MRYAIIHTWPTYAGVVVDPTIMPCLYRSREEAQQKADRYNEMDANCEMGTHRYTVCALPRITA